VTRPPASKGRSKASCRHPHECGLALGSSYESRRRVADYVADHHDRPQLRTLATCDARDLVPALRAAGIRHVARAAGDRTAVAAQIGSALGVDRVYGEQTPEDKLAVVRARAAGGRRWSPLRGPPAHPGEAVRSNST
jgi:hypothetical protein